MKKNSIIDYYFYSKTFCKFCKQEFPIGVSMEERKEHVKKYHDDEMDFEDHIKAHKDGKCGCNGVELSR